MTESNPLPDLATHPRAIGILFLLLLLIAQAETALAGGVAVHGP